MELWNLDFNKNAEMVSIEALKPHPKNYKSHPQDQIMHLVTRIKEHGLYHNIIVTKDLTILVGHGLVQALLYMGIKEVPVIRYDLDFNEPRALKLLAGDNEIGHLAENDDRALSEILKEIKEHDLSGLLGTGYDEFMLANLIFVTRPQTEINDIHEAADWVGMPEFEGPQKTYKISVHFLTKEDRTAFAKLLNTEFTEKTNAIWFPLRGKDDISSVKFE